MVCFITVGIVFILLSSCALISTYPSFGLYQQFSHSPLPLLLSLMLLRVASARAPILIIEVQKTPVKTVHCLMVDFSMGSSNLLAGCWVILACAGLRSSAAICWRLLSFRLETSRPIFSCLYVFLVITIINSDVIIVGKMYIGVDCAGCAKCFV